MSETDPRYTPQKQYPSGNGGQLHPGLKLKSYFRPEFLKRRKK